MARSAIDDSGRGVLLTARAECFLYGHADPLRGGDQRLQAFAEAGADVLLRAGCRGLSEDITAIVEAVRPYAGQRADVVGHRTQSMTTWPSLGVRRISVGSALTRVAWGAFLAAARKIADDGSTSRGLRRRRASPTSTGFSSSTRPHQNA